MNALRKLIGRLISKVFGRADQKTGMTYNEMLERAYKELAIKEMTVEATK